MNYLLWIVFEIYTTRCFWLNCFFYLTENSLLKSIEIESFIYHHEQSSSDRTSASSYNRDRLLANLEDNLANLSLLEINSVCEERNLLNQAVDLRLSVHREIRKIRITELD